MTGGQFEVHASPFSVGRFVFDSNVGDGNLSANDLESVRVGDGVFAVGGITVFAELREVAIKMLLQFVVENDAKVASSLVFDLCGRFLIEPVEVGIVMSLAGFGEAVVKRLRFAGTLGLREKAMTVLGKSEQVGGSPFPREEWISFRRDPDG